jgi:hypothetical protein
MSTQPSPYEGQVTPWEQSRYGQDRERVRQYIASLEGKKIAHFGRDGNVVAFIDKQLAVQSVVLKIEAENAALAAAETRDDDGDLFRGISNAIALTVIGLILVLLSVAFVMRKTWGL